MPYTESQKTKLFLIGLRQHPEGVTALPPEVREAAADLFAAWDALGEAAQLAAVRGEVS